MNNSFNDLGISPPILKAIAEMGFETPTEVQSRAIPHILNREDLIVMSKTGSGKTAVFGIPMLQMADPQAAGPQGLILTPTRELAVQIDSDIKKMSKHLRHKTTAVYGQHSINTEIQALNRGVSIVVGTPGRVIDHIQQGNLVTKHLRFLVLDEADRMLDMGFIIQVEKIVKTLPKDRLTMLFSATMPSEVRHISMAYMKQPVTIEIESPTKTVDAISQAYYRVERNEKRTMLHRLLLAERPESCMIFCNTRVAVDQVQSFLSRKGYACQSLHGDIPQAKRMKTIEQFKRGGFHILVATDVAARGIHIEDLSLVINYDVPNEKDSYVHRIGRTGRAGHDGRAITLVISDDIMSLYEIEEHIGALIPEADLPSEADISKRREEVEQWKSANAQKSKPPQATSASGDRSGQRQSNHKKPYQKHQGDKQPNQRQAGESQPNHKQTGQKQPYRQNEKRGERPAYSNAPRKPYGENRKPYNENRNPQPGGQTYANRSAEKPVSSQAASESSNRQDTQAVRNPAPAVKKPFFQRLLDLIAGKQG